MEGDRTLAQQPPATAEHLGDWTQLRQTDEHVYGYVLQLWRDRTQVVGLWSSLPARPRGFPDANTTADVRLRRGNDECPSLVRSEWLP